MTVFCFTFLLLPFYLPFQPGGRKGAPPIIGRTCAFDAKIYKNVDGYFAVSLCVVWNKKIFKLFYFYFQLPSLLVDFLDKILPISTAKKTTINHELTRINTRKYQIIKSFSKFQVKKSFLPRK